MVRARFATRSRLCREHGIPVMLADAGRNTFRALYPSAIDTRREQFVNELVR